MKDMKKLDATSDNKGKASLETTVQPNAPLEVHMLAVTKQEAAAFQSILDRITELEKRVYNLERAGIYSDPNSDPNAK